MYSVLYHNYMALASNTYRQILSGSELLALTSKNIAKGHVTLHAITMQPAVQHQGKTVMDLSISLLGGCSYPSLSWESNEKCIA